MDMGPLWEWVQLSSCVHLQWLWWHQGWIRSRLRLIARAIRVRRSHHHSQFYNTFYFTLAFGSLSSSLFRGQWPNGSSSISLAALTIPANYFPCRVIFLCCAASELQPVQCVIISTFTRLIYQYFSLSLSLSPTSFLSIAVSPKLAPTSHIWLQAQSWRLYCTDFFLGSVIETFV